MTKHLYIVDGHYRLYKAFFAVASGLTTPAGEPINAAYGFVSSILKLIKIRQPDYLVVAFDMPGKTFRNDIYTEYKANRKTPPDDFIVQIPVVKNILEVMNIPYVGIPGIEADDIIGSVAKQWNNDELKVWLVTGDKDAKQLLAKNVAMYDIDKNNEFTTDDLYKEWNIKPEQVVDLMALTGDTSDNVPGIPKVGQKTALPLIQKYKTLDKIFENPDQIIEDVEFQLRGKASLVKKLKTNQDIAKLSKDLVTIKTDVEIPIAVQDTKFEEAKANSLLELFQNLGFTTFIRELELIEKVNKHIQAEYICVIDEKEFNRFKSDFDKTAKKTNEFAICVEVSDVKIADNSDKKKKASLFSFFDSEEYEEKAEETNCQLLGFSICMQKSKAYYFPLQPYGNQVTLDCQKVLSYFKPLLKNKRFKKVGYDLKKDIVAFKKEGVFLKNNLFDNLVSAYILNPGKSKLEFENLAIEFLGRKIKTKHELLHEDISPKHLPDIELHKLADYSAQKADISLQLNEFLTEKIKQAKLVKLVKDIEYPLIEVLAEIEFNGIKVDGKLLQSISQKLGEKQKLLQDKIYKEVGYEFNIKSPKELQKVLFDDRKLPVIKKTPKSGPSTDEEVLEELAVTNPEDKLPAMVNEFREIFKLKSTYADALPKLVDSATQNIHTSFNQCTTATGRLSSTDPNLQNIPVKTEAGRQIRQAFIVSKPENILLSADYSQIELRFLAHFSQDDSLVKAFLNNDDIHLIVSSEIFEVAQELVTPEMRNIGKTINFSVIYGKTPYGLSKQLHIPFKDAKRFIDNYFERFSKVQKYFTQVLEDAQKTGYVTTISGRRRYLPELKNVTKHRSQRAEREGINTTIQGSAADLIKIAMIDIQNLIKREKLDLKILLQIHDELIFETPISKIEEYSKKIVNKMESAMKLSVPLKVNISQAKNWAGLK